jgi:sulfonate transport system permease protein
MKRLLNFLTGGVGVVLLLAVWQGAFTFGLLHLQSLPAPIGVARSLGGLLESGEIFPPLLHTLWVVTAGSVLALAIGTAAGAVMGLSPLAYMWGMASFDFLRTLPVVALLPIAVLLWGPSTKSELIITTYAAAWVMTINTAGAFTEVHPRLGDVCQTFQLSRLESVRKVWLPAIAPAMLVGARLSVVVAAISATIAETLVNPQGLGWEIVRSQQALQPGKLWSYAVVAGLFGYLLNVVLVVTARRLTPGSRVDSSMSGV